MDRDGHTEMAREHAERGEAAYGRGRSSECIQEHSSESLSILALS